MCFQFLRRAICYLLRIAPTMKPKTLLISALAIAASGLALLLPDTTHGAADADVSKTAALLQQLQAQQKTVSENQAKIDEKLAAVAEEIRLARIFVSRGGRK